MKTKYEVLVSVHVEHKYFPDGFFDAFELIPDEKTKSSIQAFGLMTKKVRNNWYLFFQSEGPRKTDSDSLVNKEFTFVLDIRDSGFDQYTSADLITKAKAIQFYAAAINNQFISSTRFIEHKKFDYMLQHSERPVNLKLKKFKGDVLKDVAIVEPSVKTYAFDVTVTGEQPYDISENTLPATEEKKREIYVYESYFSDRFYGVVYLKVFPPNGGNNNRYSLIFEKK